MRRVAIPGCWMMRLVVDSADVAIVLLVDRRNFQPQSFTLLITSLRVFRGESKNDFHVGRNVEMLAHFGRWRLYVRQILGKPDGILQVIAIVCK